MVRANSAKNKDKKKKKIASEKKADSLKSLAGNDAKKQKKKPVPADKPLNSLKEVQTQLDDFVIQREIENKRTRALEKTTQKIARQLEKIESQFPKHALIVADDLQQIKSEFKKKSDKFKKKTQKLTHEIATFKALTDRVKRKVSSLENSAAGPDNEQLKSLSQNQTTLANKISQFKDDLNQLTVQFAQPDQTADDLGGQLKQLTQVITELQQKTDTQNQQFSNKISDIEQAQTEHTPPLLDHLQQLENSIQSLKQDSSQQNLLLSADSEKLSELAARVNEVQEQQNTADEQHNELAQQSLTQQQQLEQVSEHFNHLSSDQKNLSDINEKIQSNVNKLSEKLNLSHANNEQKITELDGLQQKIKSHLHEVESQQKKTESHQDEHSASLTHLSEQIKTRSVLFSIGLIVILAGAAFLFFKQNTLPDETEKQTQLAQLKSEINDETQTKINTLTQQNNDTINQQLNQIKNSIQLLKENTAQTQQAGLQNAQKDWQNQQQSLQQEITSLNTEQQTLNQTVYELSGKFDTMTGKFEQLEHPLIQNQNLKPSAGKEPLADKKPSGQLFGSEDISDISEITETFYTIQLIGVHKKESMENFLQHHQLSDKVRFYQTELQGKPWYILLYGHYASYSQAIEQQRQLPENLLKFHPWIRKLP